MMHGGRRAPSAPTRGGGERKECHPLSSSSFPPLPSLECIFFPNHGQGSSTRQRSAANKAMRPRQASDGHVCCVRARRFRAPAFLWRTDDTICQPLNHPQPAPRGCRTSRAHSRKLALSSNGSPIGLGPCSPSLLRERGGANACVCVSGAGGGRLLTLPPFFLSSSSPPRVSLYEHPDGRQGLSPTSDNAAPVLLAYAGVARPCAIGIDKN